MRRVIGALLPLLVLALAGCDGDGGVRLIVDLRTDYRAGFDFTLVRTTVVEAPRGVDAGARETQAATVGDDYLAGQRIAELSVPELGSYLLSVELLDASSTVVASRQVRVDVMGSRTVTAIITSDCYARTCPGVDDPPEATECLSGRCVRPECTADDPDACGEPSCTSDDDCPASSECGVGRCSAGVCFQEPDDDRCGAEEYCDVADGCLPVPVMIEDAGPPPEQDAGPSCDPSLCDDGDPCTFDTCSGGRCVFPPRCDSDEYCELGACYPEPTFEIYTTDGAGCADLARDHSADPDYLWRRVVTGRPGETVQQYNEHVSCGDPVEPAESFALDGSGDHEERGYSMPWEDCWAGLYGRWRAHVEVDGRRSNDVYVTYYNSDCPNVATCSAARTFCSPCRDCDADEYCYAGTGCAPEPTLSFETPNGPGCVDLGQDHLAPDFTWRRTVTGRATATATQYNEHVSCGTPPASADEIALSATGTSVEEGHSSAQSDCTASVLGRWRAWVDVDGEQSDPVYVTYYNSSCPGADTCSAAASFCPP